jgi:peroxiredoxin
MGDFCKDRKMTDTLSGNSAPDFSVSGLDGKTYVLKSLLQKGLVVAAFFKISCPVCQFTAPFLERLFQRYGGNAVTFLGISQDDAKSTSKFAAEFGMTFPVAIDAKGYPASNAYGLTMVPTIFLIDSDGAVKVSSMGFAKQDLETIATELARRRNLAPAALFRADERVPAQKPG